MDYDVPSVDERLEKTSESGVACTHGDAAAAQMVLKYWEDREQLDDRTVSFLQEAIDELECLKALIVPLLNEAGDYTFADHSHDDE